MIKTLSPEAIERKKRDLAIFISRADTYRFLVMEFDKRANDALGEALKLKNELDYLDYLAHEEESNDRTRS